jgi:hypothetical protein
VVTFIVNNAAPFLFIVITAGAVFTCRLSHASVQDTSAIDKVKPLAGLIGLVQLWKEKRIKEKIQNKNTEQLKYLTPAPE